MVSKLGVDHSYTLESSLGGGRVAASSGEGADGGGTVHAHFNTAHFRQLGCNLAIAIEQAFGVDARLRTAALGQLLAATESTTPLPTGEQQQQQQEERSLPPSPVDLLPIRASTVEPLEKARVEHGGCCNGWTTVVVAMAMCSVAVAKALEHKRWRYN